MDERDNELGCTGTMGLECPGAVGVSVNELLDALIVAHRHVDALLAMMITHDPSFLPSQWPLWPDVVKRAELIRKHGQGMKAMTMEEAAAVNFGLTEDDLDEDEL